MNKYVVKMTSNKHESFFPSANTIVKIDIMAESSKCHVYITARVDGKYKEFDDVVDFSAPDFPCIVEITNQREMISIIVKRDSDMATWEREDEMSPTRSCCVCLDHSSVGMGKLTCHPDHIMCRSCFDSLRPNYQGLTVCPLCRALLR